MNQQPVWIRKPKDRCGLCCKGAKHLVKLLYWLRTGTFNKRIFSFQQRIVKDVGTFSLNYPSIKNKFHFSMEECETLCNRLLIMVQGQLVCIGASQQLKQTYGAGYDITVKLNPERSIEEFAKIKEKMQASFICELRDEHPVSIKTNWINSW